MCLCSDPKQNFAYYGRDAFVRPCPTVPVCVPTAAGRGTGDRKRSVGNPYLIYMGGG